MEPEDPFLIVGSQGGRQTKNKRKRFSHTQNFEQKRVRTSQRKKLKKEPEEVEETQEIEEIEEIKWDGEERGKKKKDEGAPEIVDE